MLRPVERFEVRMTPPPAPECPSRLGRILVAGLLPALAMVGALATLAAIDRDLGRTAQRVASYLPYDAAASSVAGMLETLKGPAKDPPPQTVAGPVPVSLRPPR